MRTYHVYITSSRSHAIYVGATGDLVARIAKHRAAFYPRAHSAVYRVQRLVYFEPAESWPAALARERQIKGWRRARKIALIESMNPRWRDLAEDFGFPPLPRMRPDA